MGNALLQVQPLTSRPAERLESWKEIAAHLRRSVRTVKRWEKIEGLPVHRLAHSKAASVYAYRSELEGWWAARRPHINGEGEPALGESLRLALLRRVPCIVVASFVCLLIYLTLRLALR